MGLSSVFLAALPMQVYPDAVRSVSYPLLAVSIALLLYSIFHLLVYRRKLEKKTWELAESENRYARITLGANDGLWDWDLRTNEIYFSPRWETMIGADAGALPNKLESWFSLVHPDDIENLKNTIAAHVKEPDQHVDIEYRIKHKDGTYLWVRCRGLAAKDKTGAPVWIAGSQTDITGKRKAEDQLIYDAFHDGLTGLPNRALFIDHLQISFARKKRYKDYRFAVLFLDLDRFKNVNDSFGHLFGNRLLEEVARRIGGSLRAQDTFARFGGDEFALLLDDIADVKFALAVAERTNRELAQPFEIDGQKVFANASIGVTTSEKYERPEDMLRDADIAMYKAKCHGRGCYVVFDESMRHEVMSALQMETALREALKNDGLLIYYQPIVSLKTKAIVGFEALLRWHHPVLGFVPTMQFIPLAEETGLIVPIGKWVLEGACRQLLDWQKRFPATPPLTVAVNVSSRQLYHPGFVASVAEILRETGIDPCCLNLELTESCLLENARTLPVLRKLSEMGVKINIDDFGTGYSSLSYIQQYPLNALKIDRSFINKMGLEGEDSAVVRAITSLAQSLHLDVIAEGIENGEHVPILQSLNCNYAQGYFFSYPLSDRDAEGLLATAKPE